MAKRKKKLLFDVLDTMFDPPRSKSTPARSSPAASRRSRGKTESTYDELPPRGGELRLSYNMAWTLGFVGLGFLVCAYYFGLVHGRSGDGGSKAPRMRPGLSRTVEDRTTWGPHYAVRACTRTYNPDTYEALLETFSSYETLLVDEGYDYIDSFRYEREDEPGHGRLVLWVGRARTAEELDGVAMSLRKLEVDGEGPFGLAYVKLFKD